MKQFLRDLPLLLRKDRKTQIAAGVISVFVIALLVLPSPNRRPQKAGPAMNELGTGAMGTDESYSEILTVLGSDIKDIQGKLGEMEEANRTSRKEFEEFENRTAQIFTGILDRINDYELKAANGGAGGDPVGLEDLDRELDLEGGESSEMLEAFGPLNGTPPLPPAPPARQPVVVIGPGDAVRVEVIAGVHAPTDGTPYPVVMKVIGDVTGPDGTKLPIGEARIIAAAQGSLADARALFRLTTLSLRLPDGQRRVYPVDGWIVGEDGIRGMSGRLIDHLPTLVPAAGFLGAVEGAANAVSASQFDTYRNSDGDTHSVFTGDVAKSIGAGAAGGAITPITKAITKRMEELVPHVEILSGREATAVFAEPLFIDSLYDQLAEDDLVYTSLD